MSKHTPTPWHVGNYSNGGTTYYDCLLTEDGRAVGQAWIPGEATHDAAFIVKAVNSHESLKTLNAELVEALEDAKSGLELYANGLRITEEAELRLVKINDALAKAKNLD